jgi:subtilase family serine protease
MRAFRALLRCLAWSSVCSALCFAVQPDRISAIDSSQAVSLKGNMHGLARAEFDQGRAEGSKLLSGLSLVFKPSAAQQAALDALLIQQQDRSSPNYHKWLTPAQFADRFGMTRNDIQKVVSWLQSQGFTVTRVANSRNQVFFEGKVAQVESAFHTEIHNYLFEGEMHFANATEPSVPAALSGMTLGLQHLHNFQPRARAKVRVVPAAEVSGHFTSHLTGNHFLAPADFATIYDVNAFYTGGTDGAGQKIAVVGQSAVSLTDIDNFRNAAGLLKNDPTPLLEPSTGVSTKCSGDEGESDLDLEWSGGVARNATIIFIYAGLLSGETCLRRTFGAFDALQYAVDHNLAPIISNSYGNCEAAVGNAFALSFEGVARQANAQGQTIFSASGDSGAADCDFRVTSATKGLAVDIPAAIPEVTGVGGTEFDPKVDVAGTLTGAPPNSNAGPTTYWSGTTNFTDTLSSALSYIPEIGWNDSAFDIQHGGTISASGGGASIYFPKPFWQAATGVPGDNVRDVPDISINASADHDGYLFCSEDASVGSCSNGFRDNSSQHLLTIVGGTSAGAPTMSGILALLNQQLGITPPNGSGNLNPVLYRLASSYPAAFNDVASGNNIVPCTAGTPNCTGGQLGFNASAGYDQVTGLGSVNAFALAQSTQAPDFDFVPDVNSLSITQGQKGTVNFTITPLNGFTGTFNFSSTDCSGLPAEATCTFSPPTVSVTGATPATVTLTIQTTAPTAKLIKPLDGSHVVFYAALLPGLVGMFAMVLPRKARAHGIRMLSLVIILASSALWMGACGNSTNNSNRDPGTPKGPSTIVVTATSGGSAPITNKATILLHVN